MDLEYGLTLSSAPAVEPVTYQDILDFAEMPGGQQARGVSAQPAVLDRMCKTARKQCEDFTGRAFVNQSWQLTLDAFPSCGGDTIWLPKGPSSVTTVVYLDTDGDSTTLSSSLYRFEAARGRLTPDGQSWPSTYGVTNAVTITFVAGYGAAKTDVPEGLRDAICMLVLDRYENRRGVFAMPNAVKELLLEHWTGRM